MIDIFQQVFQATENLAASAPLAGAGAFLTWGLPVLAITWTGIRAQLMGDGVQHLIAELVKIVILTGLVWYFLDDGAAQIRTSAAQFADLAGAVGGEMNPQAALGRMMYTAWSVMEIGGDGEKGALQKVLAAVSDDGYMLSLIYRLVTALVIMLAAGIYVGVVLLADILLAVAIIFAPVMLPWLVLGQFSHIAQGWLMFFLKAGFTKAVAALIMAMTSGFLEQIQNAVKAASSDVSVNFTAYSGAAIMCLIFAYVMSQAPTIAGALFGGFSSLTLPLGGPGASAGRMVNAAPARAGQAVKAASSAAKPSTPPAPGAK